MRSEQGSDPRPGSALQALFVTFHYPPFNAVAGLRASKITRELLALGVDVRVLTADRDDVPRDLAVEIPETRIDRTGFLDVNALPKLVVGRGRVRTRGFELGRRGSLMRVVGEIYRGIVDFPDGQVGWYPEAVRAGDALLRSWRPDVIVSVASPWTSHLVGRSLARRHRLPWVAEYQDPWTDARSRRRPWPLSVAERALEDRVVGDADGIVAVSDAWGDDLRRRFPRVRVDVVPCGFDPAEHLEIPPAPHPPLTVAYTGRLYERQDPRPLFDAIGLLLERQQVAATEIRVEFFGRYLGGARAALVASGVDRSIVSISDPLSHADAVRVQARSHVLVLFLTEDDDVGCRPAKLYEYLAARRPILVTGGSPEHEAARIVADCRAGIYVPGKEAIAAQLSAWARELRDGGSIRYEGDAAAIARYSWRRLAESLIPALRAAAARPIR